MKRLLLVDDDPDVLDAVGSVLAEDFEVVSAADGGEALRLLGAERFDVVLLDMMMPVVGGEGVVQGMRAAGVQVPVLLGSAIPDLRDVANRLAVHCMAKPYELRRLVAKLTQLAGDDAGGPALAG